MTTKRSRKATGPEVVKVGNVAVKIYRRQTPAGYTRFEVADYSTGKRALRGFNDYDAAVTEATRIARLMASGETTAAQMRGADAASYGRAIEVLRPTGFSLEVACATFADAVAALGGNRIGEAVAFFKSKDPDRLTPRTVAETVAELVAVKGAKGKSERYLQDLRSRLGRFADAFQCPVSSVTGPQVQQWLDGLKLSPQTVKNFRTVLHGLFRFAETRGYILRESNPVAFTERVEVNGGDIEIYTPAEVAALLAAAAPDFLPCIAIQAFAGVRSAECERLTWEDLDLHAGHIKLAAERTKTAARRIVPILPNLAQWLAPYAGRKGKVWRGSHEDFYTAQQETAVAAGIAWKANGLRHSFVSYRLASVKSASQVALEAGNSAEVVFKHYREVVTEAQAATWFAVAPERAANIVTVSTTA